jgi:hypothetical protein
MIMKVEHVSKRLLVRLFLMFFHQLTMRIENDLYRPPCMTDFTVL